MQDLPSAQAQRGLVSAQARGLPSTQAQQDLVSSPVQDSSSPQAQQDSSSPQAAQASPPVVWVALLCSSVRLVVRALELPRRVLELEPGQVADDFPHWALPVAGQPGPAPE